MKRALILALVGVMAFSVVTLGGLNFGAQQNVDAFTGTYPLEAYIGYDFEARYIDMSPLSIAGELTLTRADLWNLSGITLVDGGLTFSYLDDVDVILSSNAEIDFAPLPIGINLSLWSNGVEVVGHINSVLDIFVGVNLAYRFVPKDFITSFFFGFDAEW